MPVVTQRPVSGGTKKNEWYGNRKLGEIEESVAITANSSIATLSQKLPARCAIKWVQIKHASAISVAGDGTGTADTYALVNAATTGTSSASSSVLLFASTTLTKNTDVSNASVITANTTTSEQTLYLLPTDSGGSRYVSRNTTNATSGYHFDATGTVYVRVFYEEMVDITDAA